MPIIHGLWNYPIPFQGSAGKTLLPFQSSDAEKLGIKTGTLIKLTEGLSLPAFIQPGQAEGTISVSLGYGHTNAGPVCNNVGINMYPFIRSVEGTQQLWF